MRKPINLVDVVRLAMEGIANCLDEKREYLPYFECWLRVDPPKLVHGEWDYVDITGRNLYALILGREMTGEKQYIWAEEKIRKLIFSSFSKKDGLCYRPNPGKRMKNRKYITNIHGQRSIFLALSALIKYNDDQEAKESGRKLTQGLDQVSKRHPEGLAFEYSADGYFWPKDGISYQPYTSGRNIYPLIEYFKASNDDLATELVKRFIDLNLQCFAPDGQIKEVAEYYPWLSHFHSISATVAGIIEYGRITGNHSFIEVGKRIYDHPCGLKRYGSSFGWFKENILSSEDEGEICCTADMVDIALLLAQSGYPEYWNEVEKFVRNHLLECQFSDISWVKQTKVKEDTYLETYRNVKERARGIFAGWPLPNDFVPQREIPDVQFCCTGHAVQSLFKVWYNIVTKDPFGIYVNLWFDKSTDWVDIKSYLPVEGKIELKMKGISCLLVRIPTWVNQKKIKTSVNGKIRETEILNSYLKISGLKKGDRIKIETKLPLKKEQELINKKLYHLEWKGDTLISILPKGEKVPLYQRKGDRGTQR